MNEREERHAPQNRYSLVNAEAIGVICLTAFGAYFVWQGLDYPLGSIHRPGPALFPVGGGIVLVALALLILLSAKSSEAKEVSFAARPLLAISAGILAWCLMVEPFGLVPATASLVAIGAFATRTVNLMVMVAVAVLLSILAVVVFVWGLGIPLRPFGW